ncbi:MAG: hypothetical protein ACM3UZ_00850 [Acidobacteriota bacterium]
MNCILYPPTINFNWMVQRPQQLMKAFASLGVKVYFTNPGIKPYNKPIEIQPNLFLIRGKQALKEIIEKRPIFYFSSAYHVRMINTTQPSLVVYDCLDEATEEFAHWAPYFRQAVTKAHLVLATSQKLFNSCKTLNANTILVPNACADEFFEKAQRPDTPIPDDMKGIPHPVIGYCGAVASWCDFELIIKVADAFPNCSVVMIGPLYKVTSVPQRPNLYWLGLKSYSQLPQYLKCFDVGMIPFRVSSMTSAVNPIKMWEYMAFGMPVVSTALPETAIYPEVYYSSDHEEFLSNISRSLELESPELRQARVELARSNTWLARARVILDAMKKTLSVRERRATTSSSSRKQGRVKKHTKRKINFNE